MTIRVLLFGIVRERAGSATFQLQCAQSITVHTFRRQMEEHLPVLRELGAYAVAVDQAFANEDVLLTGAQEVAIVPPVSGG